MNFVDVAAVVAHRCMADRPLIAAGTAGASGSLSAFLLWLLKETTTAPIPAVPPFDLGLCDCPVLEFPKFDFWAGLAIGVLVCPLIELAVLLKQWVTLSLRNRIAGLHRGTADKLYQVLG